MPKIESFEMYSKEYEQWFINHPELYAAEIKVIRQLTPFRRGGGHGNRCWLGEICCAFGD